MKKAWWAWAFLAGMAPAWADPVVIVVRHGEKADESRDTALSPAGRARAERLAAMLKSAGVKGIYTTEFRRTRELAAPLAAASGVAAVAVAGAEGGELLAKIRAHPAGDTVLVVGHSSTVPRILAALGHKGEVKIDDAEYDNLFVLVPRAGEAPALVRLRY